MDLVVRSRAIRAIRARRGVWSNGHLLPDNQASMAGKLTTEIASANAVLLGDKVVGISQRVALSMIIRIGHCGTNPNVLLLEMAFKTLGWIKGHSLVRLLLPNSRLLPLSKLRGLVLHRTRPLFQVRHVYRQIDQTFVIHLSFNLMRSSPVELPLDLNQMRLIRLDVHLLRPIRVHSSQSQATLGIPRMKGH